MSYIVALVIQQDHTIYRNSDGTFGNSMLIPTPSSGGQVDSDYWATPVVNFGIIGTGFTYTPCKAGDAQASAPDVQSFHCVRIIKNDQSTEWYAIGTSGQYIDASKDVECCTSPPVLMPTTPTTFYPSQIVCNQDTNGLYFANIGAPAPLGALAYFPVGYYNGVALPAAAGAGYASSALLLTFLNTAVTGWAAVGTWTKTADDLTFIVTQTAGSGTDVLAAAITLI